MMVNLKHNRIDYIADLSASIDISIPISSKGPVAWSQKPLTIRAVKQGGWVGDVCEGSAVNFNAISFNPHAHTTHTECVGHISAAKEAIRIELSTFFFISKLITITPQKKQKDAIITKRSIEELVSIDDHLDALIIRTMPNSDDKMFRHYSQTNPPYLVEEAAKYIADINVKHLLIDLPSIDKEEDGGALSSHKSFWGFPDNTRHGATITELIYVSNTIKDGFYLLNLQCLPFENDASPSRPLLFNLIKEKK